MCDLQRGKSSGAKWMHLETGEHLLGGCLSHHMHASECRNDSLGEYRSK